MALLYDSIVQVADDLFSDLDDPSDVTISSIAAYLKANIGDLNILTNESYVVHDDQSVTPPLSQNVAGVLKAIYLIRYYNKKILGVTGAAGYSPVKRVSSDGFVVEYSDSVSLSKFWLDMKRAAQIQLNDLVNAYKIDKTLPGQVVGDDNYTRFPYANSWDSAAYVRGVEF